MYKMMSLVWQLVALLSVCLVLAAGAADTGTSIAGQWHAAILPRQHDHVFRPQRCVIAKLLYLLWLFHLDTET